MMHTCRRGRCDKIVGVSCNNGFPFLEGHGNPRMQQDGLHLSNVRRDPVEDAWVAETVWEFLMFSKMHVHVMALTSSGTSSYAAKYVNKKMPSAVLRVNDCADTEVHRLLNNRITSQLEVVALALGFHMVLTSFTVTTCPSEMVAATRMLKTSQQRLSVEEQVEYAPELEALVAHFKLDVLKSNVAINYLLRPVREYPWLATMTCFQSQRFMVKGSNRSTEAVEIDDRDGLADRWCNHREIEGGTLGMHELAMRPFQFPHELGDVRISGVNDGEHDSLFNGPWRIRSCPAFVRWVPVKMEKESYRRYMESKCWMCLGYYYDISGGCIRDETSDEVDFTDIDWGYHQQRKHGILDPHTDAIVELTLFLEWERAATEHRRRTYVIPEFTKRSLDYSGRFDIDQCNFDRLMDTYKETSKSTGLTAAEMLQRDVLQDDERLDTAVGIESVKAYPSQLRAVTILHDRLTARQQLLQVLVQDGANSELVDKLRASQVQAALVGMGGCGKSYCVALLVSLQESAGVRRVCARIAPTAKAVDQLGPGAQTIFSFCDMDVNCTSKMQVDTAKMREFEESSAIAIDEGFYTCLLAMIALYKLCQKYPLHPSLQDLPWGGRDILLSGASPCPPYACLID